MRLARLIVGLLSLVALAKGCGIIVHTELVRRAQTSYNDPTFGNGFVAQVLANHPGAAQVKYNLFNKHINEIVAQVGP